MKAAEKLAREKQRSFDEGYDKALKDIRVQNIRESVAILQATTEILREAGKAMSRAGYMVDKLSGRKMS